MSLPLLLIFGSGGHAAVVADAVIASGTMRIAGFVDHKTDRLGDEVLGFPVVGVPRDALNGKIKHDRFIVGIGDNEARARVFHEALMAGLRPASVVHPTAIVAASATVGDGTLVCAGSVVNVEARLAQNIIVNTRASIDHHCLVGDHAHVAPGVTLGGTVEVAEGALVGIGAAVLPGKVIGRWSVVGAGAVVTNAVVDGMTVTGTPARPLTRG